MINPQQITKFDRDEAELQEFLLFCVLVHGKKAHIQAEKLEMFLSYLAAFTGQRLPFKMVNIAMNYEISEEDAFEDFPEAQDMLTYAMKKFGLGQYDRIFWAIDDFLKLDKSLKDVTLEELENCFAVGPKTARFFLVHSRPNQEHAILDTHVLKWLTMQGVEKVPKNTPQGKWYSFFEKIFLTKVKESGKTVAEFDLAIWKSFSTI